VVVTYDGSGVSEGIQFYYNGEFPGSRFLRNWADTIEGDFDSQASLQIGGKVGEGTLATAGQDLQIYNRQLTAAEVLLLYTQRRLGAVAKKEKRSDTENKALAELYGLANNGEYRKAFLNQAELETKRNQIVSRAPETLVWKEKDEAPVAWILERGEYDKQGEQVEPGVPAILHPMVDGEPKNRLGLAKWLVDAKNPLTARVMANRFWVEVFGTGLVTTVGGLWGAGHDAKPSGTARLVGAWFYGKRMGCESDFPQDPDVGHLSAIIPGDSRTQGKKTPRTVGWLVDRAFVWTPR
jgi:hypothetical protein